MRGLSKINTKLQKVFTKQLSLVNLAVMSIIMNYLPKSNGKDNCIKSHFCLSCKNVEMSLRSVWHMESLRGWLQLRFDFDSTVIRPMFDFRSTAQFGLIVLDCSTAARGWF